MTIKQDTCNNKWYELDLSPEHTYSIFDTCITEPIYVRDKDRFKVFWDNKELPRKFETFTNAVNYLIEVYELLESNLLDKEI